MRYRRLHHLAVLIGTMALVVLTACSIPPAPTPTPEVVITPTQERSPQATPSTRTAPTLPPEWTKTFTPTSTLSPTPTITRTATTLPSEAEICAAFTFELELSDDQPVSATTGINFTAGVEMPDTTINVLTRREGSTTNPESSVIQGNGLYLINFGQGDLPGVYHWSAAVSTSYYTDICLKSGTITLIAPTPTARPSLGDELLAVIIRRLREDILIPLQTPTTPTEATDVTADPSGSTPTPEA